MKPQRRQVVAFIALADAPIPATISLRDDASVELTFIGPGATADMRRWMELLGSNQNDARTRVSTDAETGGQTRVSHHLRAGTIGDQPVVLWAHEPAGSGRGEPLDDATQDKLRQVVDEPTDHDSPGREKGGAGIAAGATHPDDVVHQVLAVPLAQLDAMKTARDEVLGEGGGPS